MHDFCWDLSLHTSVQDLCNSIFSFEYFPLVFNSPNYLSNLVAHRYGYSLIHCNFPTLSMTSENNSIVYIKAFKWNRNRIITGIEITLVNPLIGIEFLTPLKFFVFWVQTNLSTVIFEFNSYFLYFMCFYFLTYTWNIIYLFHIFCRMVPRWAWWMGQIQQLWCGNPCAINGLCARVNISQPRFSRKGLPICGCISETKHKLSLR